MHNRLILFVKIAISAGVICTIGSRFALSQLVLVLHNVNFFYLVLSTSFAILAVPVVGYRWQIVSKMFSLNISVAIATSATFAGLFVGQVLPGGVGADIVRAWMVWNKGSRNQSVITSLIADRLISLSAVILIIVLSLPMLNLLLPEKTVFWIQFFVIVVFTMVSVAYFSFRKLRLTKFRKPLDWLSYKFNLEDTHLSTSVIFYSLVWAIFGHFLMILSAYFLSLAIGISSSFWMWVLIMPIVILITAIPISINGWGIREYTMVYLWATVGVIESEAFLISVCVGLVAIISSLPGLWFWIKKKRY